MSQNENDVISIIIL